ncbi:hypothetical protein [Dyella choica]|uniref:Outer membrane assembly lipoprotein YfiO n=1 Tax=Dyella choica TaxID=1927959 RepID=A0A432M8P4_9GAMM|nr:hypothetical protein [Dyella choica]RUL78260.1 hypothetical protein EKH80_05355 [Dyella choica]
MSTIRYDSQWRWFALLALLLAGMTWQSPVHASSDDCGSTAYTIDQGYYVSCSMGSMALLSPGNDTRVNLILLMADRHGVSPKAKAGSDNPPLFDLSNLQGTLFPDAAPNVVQGFGDDSSSCNQPAETAFEAALKAEASVPSSEQELLVSLHQGLTHCSKDDTGFEKRLAAAVDQVHSATGKAYLNYLQGAAAFYGYALNQAVAHFADLTKADSAWLRETSFYLLGRSAVRAAQFDAFDDQGSMKPDWRADPAVVANAHSALDAYIATYPKGLYTVSARGLKRRMDWLSGDRSRLTTDYVEAIAQDQAARGVNDADLAQEIDRKLFQLYDSDGGMPTPHLDTTDPTLLAVIDLYRMRQSAAGAGADAHPQTLTGQELETQRPHFAHQQALFGYLEAIHAFYVDRKPDQVLDLIPDEARQARLDYVQFSRQMLRGMALQAQHDAHARDQFVNMLPGAAAPFQRSALELAIALIDEHAGQVSQLFEADSPVRNPAIRGIELSYVADAPLLRKQAQDAHAPDYERETALYVLLYKELTRGFYADFLRDKALIPANASTADDDITVYRFAPSPSSDPAAENKPHQPLGVFLIGAKDEEHYACPALQDVATALAKDVDDIRARMCLAEFLRVQSFDGFTLDAGMSSGLGSGHSLFPGKPYSRLEVYKSVIADAKAKPEDKGYALYRAINCYAPSGNNSCGGVEVPSAQRKAWFQQLKKDYPGSSWAGALSYYW